MLKAIRNEKQYKNTVTRMYALMQRKWRAGSLQFRELELLSILVAVYEMQHHITRSL